MTAGARLSPGAPRRLSPADAARLSRVVAAHGVYGGANVLGIPRTTLDRVLDGGHAQAGTIARVVDALDAYDRRDAWRSA